mmetsp:Transcript_3006/g.2598  ORF Transcript_3006/g.2598 Transcript_3006/m.2598 type:complete len:107 (+) Transcript_3006:731-1051(+)
MINGGCEDMKALDIYSAGIILFLLVFRKVPYYETKKVQGRDLFKLLMTNPTKYWEALQRISGDFEYVDRDFKELFEGMTNPDPKKRFTIEQVKSSNWFRRPTYSNI